MSKLVGILAISGGLAVLLLAGTQFSKWMDRTSNPWAYATPPITGHWQGDAVAGNTRLRLVLSMTRDPFDWLPAGDSDDSHRTLSGQAVICDSTGRVQAYKVAGLVKDKLARKTLLNFSAPPGETPGLRPTRVDLSWDGGAELRGEAWMAHVLVGGVMRTSSSDPETGHPAEFRLHSTAGEEGCTPW